MSTSENKPTETRPDRAGTRLWVGVSTDAETDEIAAYVSDRYLEDVIGEKARGSAEVYERIAPKPRYGLPTTYLVGLPAGDVDTGRDDFHSSATSPDVWTKRATTLWAGIYEFAEETSPKVVDPWAIYFVGVNPPKGLSSEETEEFEEFYSTVHMPEVVERRHCLRATRWRLSGPLKKPTFGLPSYLAVYEMDGAAASIKRHTGGSYSEGPPVWSRHTTPWRHWYRLLIPSST